jgi:hypothetical protein
LPDPFDAGYQAHPRDATPPPRLSAPWADLIKAFPQVGPIFASWCRT